MLRSAWELGRSCSARKGRGRRTEDGAMEGKAWWQRLELPPEGWRRVSYISAPIKGIFSKINYVNQG